MPLTALVFYPKDEEGGPVKESLLGIAQAKRASKRKKVEEVDDTDMPDNVDQFAEKLEIEEEGGIKFMPFSLNGRHINILMIL